MKNHTICTIDKKKRHNVYYQNLHLQELKIITADWRKNSKQNQCRDPGSNRGPLDLQSNALPTELSRLDYVINN